MRARLRRVFATLGKTLVVPLPKPIQWTVYSSLILLALFVLFVGGRILWLTERAISHAQSIAQREYRRPPYRQPVVPGTFAERAEPPINAISWIGYEQWKKRTPKSSEEGNIPFEQVLNDESPVSNLFPSWRTEAEERKEEESHLISALATELGGASKSYSFWDYSRPEHEALPWGELHTVIHDLSLFALIALDEHRWADAAEYCLDGVALSRETTYGAGIEERGELLFFMVYLVPACLRVGDQVPLSVKRDFAGKLSPLLDTFPKLGDAIDVTRSKRELEYVAPFMTSLHTQRLPAGARAYVRRLQSFDELKAMKEYPTAGVVAALTMPQFWSLSTDELDAWKKVIDLSHDGLAAQTHLLDTEHERRSRQPWNPLNYGRGQRWDRWFRSGTAFATLSMEKLELIRESVLLDLYYAEHGEWPSQPLSSSLQHIAHIEAQGPTATLVLEPMEELRWDKGLRLTVHGERE
jgi:hypothetical protein